ncbi:lactonase family protein [Vibrio sp. WXL103]|uniref:lactonase family protein n=1 Tax=Vibrio sp. WXL103 TaxID=3450710 RepID=UPI003EC4F957
MSDAQFLVGCYTPESAPAGVARISLNSESGELSFESWEHLTTSPSYLYSNDKGIYAFNEISEASGSRLEFVDNQGKVHTLPSGGNYPCHIDIDSQGQLLALAHYGSGTVTVFNLNETGAMQEQIDCLSNPGSGPNLARQEAAHAHMVKFLREDDQLAYVDLGTDSIHFYQLDRASLSLELSQTVKLSSGSGPRHMVFNRDETLAYVVCELTETLVVLAKVNQQWQVLSEQRLLPDHAVTETAAAIKLSADERYVYVSCREQNILACFAVTEQGLSSLQQVTLKGQFPRDFTISQDGLWVVVANQHSSSLEVWARDKDSGLLTETEHQLDFHQPVCVIETSG